MLFLVDRDLMQFGLRTLVRTNTNERGTKDISRTVNETCRSIVVDLNFYVLFVIFRNHSHTVRLNRQLYGKTVFVFLRHIPFYILNWRLKTQPNTHHLTDTLLTIAKVLNDNQLFNLRSWSLWKVLLLTKLKMKKKTNFVHWVHISRKISLCFIQNKSRLFLIIETKQSEPKWNYHIIDFVSPRPFIHSCNYLLTHRSRFFNWTDKPVIKQHFKQCDAKF